MADPVTCDLFVQILATLEKQLWMISAQTAGSERAGADTLEIRAADAGERQTDSVVEAPPPSLRASALRDRRVLLRLDFPTVEKIAT